MRYAEFLASAVRYRDGFAVFAWHGVRVPQDMIETDWSVDQILREPNSEIRRCAIEKIGWDRLVDSMGLTPVATSPDPPQVWTHRARRYLTIAARR